MKRDRPQSPARTPLPRCLVSSGLVLLLLTSPAAADPVAPVPSVPADGSERMRVVLAEIARASDEANPYTGEAQARSLRLRADDPRLAASPSLHWRHLRELAALELRLGNSEEAVRRLTQAKALVPQLGPAIKPTEIDRGQFELAVAYLRWGEDRNCVARHTSNSCILPIRDSGVHQDQEGSRHGIAELEDLLARHPDHLVARWLLNIAYMTIGEYPDGVPAAQRIPPSALASAEPFPRFTDVAGSVGFKTMDLGGGIAVEDYDGDGFLDLVVSSSDPKSSLRYFAGRADGTFQDRSEEAGFTGLFGGSNLVQADYDNDGDVDLLVLRGAWLSRDGRHPKSLLRNDGHARFTDVTFAAGLAEVAYPSQTAAWADYDNDGDLDLYVGNEAEENLRFPSQLFNNRGDGTFADVAPAAGVSGGVYSKGVAWGDFDDDGLPDLYVSNYNGPNRLYRNLGNGSFTDIATAAGVTEPRASQALVTGDFDNDGRLDLFVSATTPLHRRQVHARGADTLAPLAAFVAGMLGLPSEGETGHLYRNLGGGRFEDITRAAGLGRVLLAGGLGVGDVDNDGRLDLYIGTSFPGFEGLMPNVMYHNRGSGGFADVTTSAGLGHLQKAGAIALADFDRDGDLDIFENAGGMFGGDRFGDVLFLNPGFGGHWLEVRLVGRRVNRSAIGARVRAVIREGKETRSIYGFAGSGSSFGANPLSLWFGLGKAGRVERLEIDWPGRGPAQIVEKVTADRRIVIEEAVSPTGPRVIRPESKGSGSRR